MIRKLFSVTLLMTVILSACSGRAPAASPTATATETQVATATEVSVTESPAATESPTTPETPSSTPEPPRPTNAPDCTNSASFVADVTIPDKSNVGAGETFTKTWRISNSGTCIWASDYTLTHYSEERMGAPDSVPLSLTFPGQTLDVSLTLTAPNSTGTYQGNFVIKNPAGLIMKINSDSRLWVIVNVTNTITVTSNAVTTTPGTGSGSGFANATCGFTNDAIRVMDAINAINAYRTQNSLPAYTVNSQLTKAAQAHANDMACNNLFVHTGSDGSTPKTRVATSGYVASFVTENVYGSYPPLTGQEAVNWWINDKTDLNHNRNLLSDTYIDIGVGYAFFNNFGYYVVVFATP